MKIENTSSKDAKFDLTLLLGYGMDEINKVEETEKKMEKSEFLNWIDDFYKQKYMYVR